MLIKNIQNTCFSYVKQNYYNIFIAILTNKKTTLSVACNVLGQWTFMFCPKMIFLDLQLLQISLPNSPFPPEFSTDNESWNSNENYLGIDIVPIFIQEKYGYFYCVVLYHCSSPRGESTVCEVAMIITTPDFV